MSTFPNFLFGSFGDEKVTSTSKIGGLPLGTRMVLPDGRVFAHARVGTTALVAGKLYQGKAGEANTIFIKNVALAATAAVAATSVSITVAGTALGAGVYDDGYLVTASSIGTGIGYLYKVKSAATTAADSTSVVSLADGEGIKVALEGGTTTVGMRKNEFDSVLLTTADTVGVNTICGVACATAAASAYVWLQRKGPAAVFTDNSTVIVGTPVIASSSVAGAVATFATAAADTTGVRYARNMQLVGEVMSKAASAEFSIVDLWLP